MSFATVNDPGNAAPAVPHPASTTEEPGKPKYKSYKWVIHLQIVLSLLITPSQEEISEVETPIQGSHEGEQQIV